jgi:hypothetical protein
MSHRSVLHFTLILFIYSSTQSNPTFHFMCFVCFAALVVVGISNCPNVDTTNTTVSVSSTDFVECISPISIGRCRANATITICTFSRCESETDGGGIWFQGTELEIRQCSFTECLAWNNGSAIYASGCPNSDSSDWTLSDNVARLGTCASHAICSSAARKLDGTKMTVERTNLTSNSGIDGAALMIQRTPSAVLEFCLFESNEGLCGIMLYEPLGSDLLRCLGFRSNVCKPGVWMPTSALFGIYSAWAVEDSVFANNSFGIFVAEYGCRTSSPYLRLRNCYFDQFPPKAGGCAQFYLTNCEAGEEIFPPWGECPNRTPRRTRTITWSISPEEPSMTRSTAALQTSESENLDVAVGLMIGLPLVVTGIAVVIFIFVIHRMKRRSPGVTAPVRENSATSSHGVSKDEAAAAPSWRQGRLEDASHFRSPYQSSLPLDDLSPARRPGSQGGITDPLT